MKHKLLLSAGLLVAVIVVIAVVEILMIKYNGVNVPTPNTPRAAESYGAAGDLPLHYVVMGDSTSVGQGGDYDNGIARTTARLLAQNHQVTFQNLGISGARAADVVTRQLPQAVALKPDFVLVSICANDVTHMTKPAAVQVSLEAIIDQLRSANPSVRIVLTGSPAMGSVPRFPQPIRYLAKLRTASMNRMVASVAADKHVTFAHLADQTEATFSKHPEYFASDKFHPNNEGYVVWFPVLEKAFDAALKS